MYYITISLLAHYAYDTYKLIIIRKLSVCMESAYDELKVLGAIAGFTKATKRIQTFLEAQIVYHCVNESLPYDTKLFHGQS